MVKKLFPKTGLLIFIIIVIPTTLFTVIELSSLNQQEKTIGDIYQKQLKSVLFSVNMYADDVVNLWVAKAGNIIESDVADNDSLLKAYTINNPQIIGLQVRQIDAKQVKLSSQEYGHLPDKVLHELDVLLEKNKHDIDKLFVYLKSNYRKVLFLDFKETEQTNVFVFAVINDDNKKFIVAITINAEDFVNEILSPRIQAIAGEEFVIGVKHRLDDRIVYSNSVDTTLVDNEVVEYFWQFPDYSIHLKPVGYTLQEVISMRARNNLWMIFGVDVLLLIAGFMVYRNIKKQIELAKIKSDFVSNVSHEIRTPLALISMYAESLQMGRVKEEVKKQKSYDIIYREANRLAGIVNNILNFSKIDNGKRSYHFSPFELNYTIVKILDNFHFHLQQNGFEFVYQPNESLPRIDGDQEAISEALINLIDNAIKYSDANKRIEIKATRNEGFVDLEVKDYGIGISEKEQKLIFQKFYRVTEGNLAHKAKGSGLGLNIVRHVVTAHGGRIHVESSPGKGSRFILSFPIHQKKSKS
ncbi:HAMP domain-containing histidine kinase [Labilibacter sediminis]|nr:HAMP domain-containing histidine kinase [Labilibacter sediminis]